jgi:flavin reductase (DIM6/NTAB) family NADH-FMN oxidoreductase RutF
MRMVPYPVAIVTSTDLSNANASFKGATVSSFNTVTMRPDPIVSLNLKKPSSTFNAIQSSNQFIVHLLMDNVEAGELAQAFTKGDSQSPFAQHPPDVQTNRVGMADAKEGADKRPPVFSETKAVSFALLCRYLSNKTVEIGDHIVMFGTVLRVLGEPESVPCLAYANRWYGHIVNFRWLAQGSDSSPKIDLVGPDTIDPLRRQLERRTANLFVANLRLMNRVQAVLGQQQEDIMDSLKERWALRDTLKRREGGKAVGPHTVQQLMRTGKIEISTSMSKGIRLWPASKQQR